ncbi:hypothetical protein CEXT_730531 [Caerostris extrusa]|uniref:Uncharacterized protein n=1 Tax=Caerostris extrusa TaxID=172846 RepID=A0AAV4NCT2_CAEEX|nr:hypothetical protein CEXT_730531 [Caerostris extrusa]
MFGTFFNKLGNNKRPRFPTSILESSAQPFHGSSCDEDELNSLDRLHNSRHLLNPFLAWRVVHPLLFPCRKIIRAQWRVRRVALMWGRSGHLSRDLKGPSTPPGVAPIKERYPWTVTATSSSLQNPINDTY